MTVYTISYTASTQAFHTFFTPSTIPIKLTYTLISRRHTNFIDLKLVNANQYNNSSRSQPPRKHLVTLGIFSLGNVIDDHGIESEM